MPTAARFLFVPHTLLAGAFILASLGVFLAINGNLALNKDSLKISWVTRAGAGLIGPACGSSGLSGGAATCSGATPIANVTWSSDASCDGGVAYLDINGTNVGNGSCSGSYAWSGGSINTGYNYEVWTNSSGSRHTISTGSFTTPASCAPSATLSASPSTIDQGESSTLTWGSTNATSCTSAGGFATGGATSGSASTGALSSTSVYQVTCNGLGGTSNPAFATVTVLVPTVNISVSPNRVTSGGSVTVTWNATNVNSCVITRNGTTWQSLTANGSRVVSGSASNAITNQTNYVMTCSNNGGASAATANIVANIVPGFQEF